jgi:hypothetical protein
MKRFRIRAKKYSEYDWLPEYSEVSVINGVVTSNTKTPSGLHFKSKKEADEETLRILKGKEKINENDIEVA